MKKEKLSPFGRVMMTLVYVFLYAPLVMMIVFSFNSSKSTSVFAGFSTKWYVELFNSGAVINALRNTLILAVLSAVIATVIGTVAAIGMYITGNKVAKKLLMVITNIPMMNPDIVTGVSMMLLFVFVGRLIGASSYLSFTTLLIAHITFNIPYVILNIIPKLRQTDINLYHAAMDLGCNGFEAFVKVVFPQIKPGIISGLLMAFTLSLDDFVISYYTSGTGFQTLPLYIYSMTKKTVKPDMYALSTLIFFVILIILISVNIYQAKAENHKNKEIDR